MLKTLNSSHDYDLIHLSEYPLFESNFRMFNIHTKYHNSRLMSAKNFKNIHIKD